VSAYVGSSKNLKDLKFNVGGHHFLVDELHPSCGAQEVAPIIIAASVVVTTVATCGRESEYRRGRLMIE
jgi:hypothetical protein